MEDNFKALIPIMGEEKANELKKLTSNYDKYIEKFKKNVNSILDSSGFEVKTGVAFVKKGKAPNK